MSLKPWRMKSFMKLYSVACFASYAVDYTWKIVITDDDLSLRVCQGYCHCSSHYILSFKTIKWCP